MTLPFAYSRTPTR